MLRLLNRFLGPLLLALLCLDGYGQDVHWTQVNTLRSLQNPAENGITEELDATLAYRNQWGSLVNAFSTIGLNINGRLANGIGLGFTAIDDRAGSAGWHQTNVYLNGSYATSIRNIHVRFGLGLGVIQQGFDQTQALFPDQIGNNLSLNPTSQTFNTTQDIGFDNTVGLFAQIPIGKNELKVGLNHNHLLQSELSLAGNTSSATGLWNAFLSYPIALNTSYGLQPYLAYFNQGGIQQAVLGSNISYTKNNVVYGGFGYRLQDAITAQVGIQYNQLRAGVAYDYTIGSLRQNAGNTSAFELMIGYGFAKKNKPLLELDTMVEVTEPMPVETILVYTYQITEKDSVTKLNGARFVLTENDPGNFRRDTMLENNLIAFVLNPCAEYTLTVSKQGYFTKEERFSTPCEIKGSVHKEFIIAMDSLEVNKTYTLQHIYYDFNEVSLTNASLDELKKLAQFLTENPTIRIELSSHTDNKGDDAYNMKLSEKRAQSCVDYLINLGIAADRLVAKGYGESQPVADNELEDGSDNPEGRALNRRTEFKILNLK